MMQNLARDEAGNVFEVDASGNVIRQVTPAAPGRGRVFSLAPNPKDQRQESRQQAADSRAEAAARRSELDWSASHNPDGTPKVNQPAMLGDPNLHGPEHLASLPQSIRARVQQLLDGRSMLTSREKGTPLGQQLMEAANQVDPTFDEAAMKARFTERQQYTGMGKGSQTVQAAERLAQHVNDLYAASRALPGPDLGFAPLSNVATGVSNQFHQAQASSYNTILPLISGELQKLTKVGAATVDESNKIEHNLRADQPQSVREAAIKEIIRLGRAQYDPLRESWASAWHGTTPPPMPMDFSPATTAIFDNIENGGEPLTMKRGKDGSLIALPATAAGSPPGAAGPTGPAAGPDGGTPPAGGPTPPALTYTPATGKTRRVPDARTDAAVNGFINQGQWALANATLQRAGFAPVSPAEQVAIQKWKKQYPHLAYNGTDVSNVEGMSAWQQMLSSSVAAPIAAGLAHYGNTATGGLPALLAGKDARGNLDVATAMNPGASLAGDVAGFVTGSYGLGKLGKAVGVLKNAAEAAPLATEGVAAAPGVLARAGNAVRAASPDLVMGVSTGATADPDHPILGGLEGAAGVGVGNAAGHYLLAPVLRAAGETRLGQAAMTQGGRLAQAIKGVFGNAGAEEAAAGAAPPPPGSWAPPARLGADEQALTRSGAFEPDSVSNIRTQLQDAARLDMPMALADTDPRLRMIAGSASRLSPDVRALAENTLGARAQGRTGRAVRMVNDHLAPTGNMADIQAANKKAAQAQSKALYEAAMGHPPVEDPALNELLNTPGGTSAARHGYDYALNKGTSPGELNMGIDPVTGQPRYDAALNWPTLQNIKIGMDANLEPFRSPLTGRLDIPHGSPAESLQALRTRYNAHLGELNSDYKAGNEAYAGVRAHGNAAQQGFDLARKMGTMNPDEVGNIAGAVKPDYLPDFQQGVASHLADRITNTERDPYALLYGPDGAQQRLHAIFPEGAPEIGAANRMEDQFGLTRTELTGGSQTEPRRAADRLFKAGIGLSGLADVYSTFHGMPPLATVAMAAGGGLARRLATNADTRLSMGVADKVGPQLLNIDPSANLDALDLLLQRYAARQAYNSQVNRAGAGAGAVLGGGAAAYEAGR